MPARGVCRRWSRAAALLTEGVPALSPSLGTAPDGRASSRVQQGNPGAEGWVAGARSGFLASSSGPVSLGLLGAPWGEALAPATPLEAPPTAPPHPGHELRVSPDPTRQPQKVGGVQLWGGAWRGRPGEHRLPKPTAQSFRGWPVRTPLPWGGGAPMVAPGRGGASGAHPPEKVPTHFGHCRRGPRAHSQGDLEFGS